MGRLTILPAEGRAAIPVMPRPVPGFTGMTLVRGRLGLGPGEPKPAGAMPAVLAWLEVKPRPTMAVRLLMPSSPPPPHWTPSAKRSVRSSSSSRDSIFTCGGSRSSRFSMASLTRFICSS